MLRLSKLTDYATVILTYMAKSQHDLHTAISIAKSTGISLPTVSKILKVLVKAKVLQSTRGAKGGYSLAHAPEKITIAGVINAVEGPIALTECSISHQGCQQATGCNIGTNWSLINQRVFNALDAITLEDMLQPIPNPEEILIPLANLSP